MNGFHRLRDKDRRLLAASVGGVQCEEFPGQDYTKKAKEGLCSLTLYREKKIVIQS